MTPNEKTHLAFTLLAQCSEVPTEALEIVDEMRRLIALGYRLPVQATDGAVVPFPTDHPKTG